MRLTFASPVVPVPRPWPVLVGVVVILLTSACGNEPDANGRREHSTAITTAAVETGAAIQYAAYAARLQSSGEVELRAQVGGVLEQRLYREGQRVEKGQTLFRIDPQPFELALERREADVLEAEAEYDSARRDRNRYRDLFARQVASEQDLDQAEAVLGVASARLKRARAARRDARRMLGYTRVEAPAAGMAGIEALAAGNLVRSGDLLTTITSLDPIQVHFRVPAPDFALHRAQFASPGSQRTRVDLIGVSREGILDYTDVHVDPLTDSVQMRAVFPNPNGELLPGTFVRVRLPLRRFENVALIDPAAVGEGPDGPRVFVIARENGATVARARSVEPGPVLDGRQVVLTGLSAGEELVVNGQVALRPGDAVHVTHRARPVTPAIGPDTRPQQAAEAKF